MSTLEQLQDAFMKADAMAQQGDQQAARDARMFADEIRKIQASGNASGEKYPIMGQVNRGIANTVGGAVDLLNPFDEYTGSAQAGLTKAMRAVGIEVSDRDPEGLVENFARGTGEAAGMLPIMAAGAGAVANTARGVAANVADDVYRGLTTKSGALAEVAAGGISRAAGQVAEDAGHPELRPYAEIAAPLAAGGAIIGAGKAAGATVRGSERLPLAGTAIKTARQVVGAVAPTTQAGARQQARDQLVREAGSEGRAQELGRMIEPETEIGLTPAQQTGDPNLLAMERAAAEEQPEIRESLAAKDASARRTARDAIADGSGEVGDARQFFQSRVKKFKSDMQQRADQALQMGDESIDAAGPRMAESTASENVVSKLKGALDEQKAQERYLWSQVPENEQVDVSETMRTFDELVAGTAKAQAGDIPAVATRILNDEALRDSGQDTVREMYGLYSELRRVARSAMAGNDKNANKARIANELAESILNDMGAIAGDTHAGRAINEARAFSAAMHETFDQGTVGRILNRTLDGDETIPGAAVLKRTVGRGGADAMVDRRNIANAAKSADEDIADYARGRFVDSITGPDGEFTPKRAASWMRKNREFLNEFPALRKEFGAAMKNRQKAEAFAAKAKVRADMADKTAIGAFNVGQEKKAVQSILAADSPAKAARSVVATARKDKTGKALAGVKAAFSDYLIGGATRGDVLTGKDLNALLNDGQTAAALRTVFSPAEFGRMKRIGSELEKLDAATSASPKGPVMDSPPAMIIDTVARIAGAKAGAKIGGGGGAGVNLQAAQIGSKRARDILGRLTNDKARQILYDAIEDPMLMRALLLEPKGTELPQWAASKITPYLAGAASQAVTE